MSENKSLYLVQLLNEVESLHKSVQEVYDSGNLPFNFLKESFNKTQEINNMLHKLEFMQIDDLRNKMERLVAIISEKENQVSTEDVDQISHQVEEGEENFKLAEVKEEEYEEPDKEVLQENIGNIYAEGIVLPEYRNPYDSDENKLKKEDTHIDENNYFNNIDKSENKKNKTKNDFNRVVYSINDTIKTSPSVIDLKRGISLNDRFLFQRELFDNDRNKMNNTIEKLNNLGSYEEAEEYIRENVSVDLENPIIIDFLSIIRKEFK